MALVGLLPVAAIWAQPAPVGAITPPMQADTALRGTVIAGTQAATPGECQARCSSIAGCTGWTFAATAAGPLPRRGLLPAPQPANCTLLGGVLAEAPQPGTVACRMPCTTQAAQPGLRQVRPLPGDLAQVPPPRPATLAPPPPPPQPGVVQPVMPMIAAGTLVVPPAPAPAPAPAAQPAPAQAAPTQITRWRYARPEGGTIVVPNQVGSHVTVCPEGRVATGSVSERLGNRRFEDKSISLGTAPTPDGRGLIHKIENPLLSVASPAGAAAICIDRPAGYQILREVRTLTPYQRARVEVGCPAGHVLIGGGTQSDLSVHTAVSAPSIDGNVWVGYFRNDGAFGTRNVETVAVCAASAAIPGRQIVSTARTQLTAGQNSDMKPACPSGKKALGVGVHADATTIRGWIEWMDPKLWENPRNRITMPKETWWGIWGNTSAPSENVFIDLRMVLICASATF